MKNLKLECLIKGYEGIDFEVGQVWETKKGTRLKVKGFDFRTSIYKLTMVEVEDSTEEHHYSSNGRFIQEWKTAFDLVKLISTKTPTKSIPSEKFDQTLEQNSSTKYMVFVEGKNTPRYIHDSYDSAETEAKRLSAKEIGCNVFVAGIVKTFKSKVIVEELK